ncbi:Calcineurin-like phosphoesterase domain, ApaH type [Candidatus Nanopelagicaceae bacterium]
MNTDSTYLLKSWVKAPVTRRSLLLMAATTAVAGTSLGKAIGVTAPVITQVLGRPTDSSIAVSVLASQPIAIYIEYGYTKTRYTGKSQELQTSPGNPAVFDLKALKANSKVYYRVNYKGSTDAKFTSGKQYSFTTARKAGSTFAFSVHGDTHPERAGKMFNSELYGVTLANIATQQPDFHIMMGDDFSIDPLIGKGQADQTNVEKIYSTHRNWLTTATSSVPLFLINGNHEQAAAYLLDGTATNPAVLAGNARLKYYPLPAPDAFYTGNTTPVEGVGLPRDYYAWTWGDALFVTLDPYWHSKNAVDNVAGVLVPEDQAGTKGGGGGGGGKKGGATPIATAPAAPTGNGKVTNLWSIGIGDEQYAWLKKTLETSKAKYKFVFAHHVMGTGRGAVEVSTNYEWGGKDPKGQTTFAKERPNWELPIHDLMVKNKVSIFFQGHDHIFCTQERDGLIYQSMPNPADDTFSMFNSDAYKSGVKAPNSGHVRVTVAPSQAKVEYFLAARSKDTDRKNMSLAHSYIVKPKV